MELVRVFERQEFGKIHGVISKGKPWLVGRDVAEALGYVNVIKALGMYVRAEDKMGCLRGIPTKDDIYIMNAQGRRIYPIWINETGVLSLVFHATTEAAKRFHQWLTDEIFPALLQPAEIIEPVEEYTNVNSDMDIVDGEIIEEIPYGVEIIPYEEDWRDVFDTLVTTQYPYPNPLEPQYPTPLDNKPNLFMERLEKMEQIILSIKEANEDLLKSNKDLVASNESMQSKLSDVTAKLLAANNALIEKEERIKQMRPAVAFTEYYGRNNEAQSADYYASALGISSRKFNVVLVSFGILREITTKGKNIHRIATGEWRKCVKPLIRSFYVTVPGKEEVMERKVMENSASPSWLPAFFPLLVGFFKSYDMLDANGKFKEKEWDKAREEVKKACKKENVEMKQAWAKEYFKQDETQFPQKFDVKQDLALPTHTEKKIVKATKNEESVDEVKEEIKEIKELKLVKNELKAIGNKSKKIVKNVKNGKVTKVAKKVKE